MANLGNVIKISQADFDTIFNAYPGSVTIHGQDVTYDPNSIYLIEDEDTQYVETVLWTNSNPNNVFASQTIPFDDLSAYDYIKVGYQHYRAGVSPTQYIEVKISNVTSSGKFKLTTQEKDTSGVRFSQTIVRNIDIDIDNSNIVFDDCWKTSHFTSGNYNHSALEIDNSYLVPTEIIGVKKGKILANDTKVLLWENSNPTSAWTSTSAQTLNGNLSDFKYFLIEWKLWRENQSSNTQIVRNEAYGWIPTQTSNRTLFVLGDYLQGGTTAMSRYISRVASVDNQITFSEAAPTSIGNYNGYLIPLRIYGCDSAYAGGMAVEDNILKAYPIGSIYMSVNATNPGDLFGGTWQRIEGKFLLGATGNTVESGTNIQKTAIVGPGGQGGQATVQLQQNELPAFLTLNVESSDPNHSTIDGVYVGYGTHTDIASRSYTWINSGGGQSHNNMPPFLSVYMWQRTA